MVWLIEDLAGDWRGLNERIEGLSDEIEALARRDVGCGLLMSVPGQAWVGAVHAGKYTRGLNRLAPQDGWMSYSGVARFSTTFTCRCYRERSASNPVATEGLSHVVWSSEQRNGSLGAVSAPARAPRARRVPVLGLPHWGRSSRGQLGKVQSRQARVPVPLWPTGSLFLAEPPSHGPRGRRRGPRPDLDQRAETFFSWRLPVRAG
jgi:hypothetical protein